MNRATPGVPGRPFTLVACINCASDVGEPVRDRLRAAPAPRHVAHLD
ncbi:hypothetical protein [Streptomyces sp. NPDC015125]